MLHLVTSLLEQLTSPENTEDIYELAVNSVHPGRVGYCQIWLDYLNYLLTRFHSLKVCTHYYINIEIIFIILDIC